MFQIIINIIGFIFFFGVYFFAPSYLDKEIIALLIIMIFGLIISFYIRKEEGVLYKQYLRHSTLIVFGYAIVHFQYHTDYLLGYVNSNYPYIWVDNTIVLKALSLSCIGLASFFLGYLIYKEKKIINFYNKIHKTYKTNILVYVASLLLILYFYYANSLYLAGFYGAEGLGTEASYIILLFKVFIFAILIQNSRNLIIEKKEFISLVSFIKAQGFLFNALILIYLMSVMISGDRGPLIQFTLAYFSSFLFVTKLRLNILKTFLLLIFGALFITLLGKVRSMERTLSFNERFSSSLTMSSRFETKSILPQTQELATSIRSLHHAIEYVPTKHGYLYGRFQFQQLCSMIPFGNAFVDLIFEDNSYKYGGSSRFITWINQGDNPYSGDGTSVISDFYLDFGLLGVIFGMFVFGYIMRFAELTMYSTNLPSLFNHALFIGYLSSAIYISRSTFLIEMKSVFWIFLVLFFNKNLLNRA